MASQYSHPSERRKIFGWEIIKKYQLRNLLMLFNYFPFRKFKSKPALGKGHEVRFSIVSFPRKRCPYSNLFNSLILQAFVCLSDYVKY